MVLGAWEGNWIRVKFNSIGPKFFQFENLGPIYLNSACLVILPVLSPAEFFYIF